MNISIKKIGSLLLLLFSIFTLAACQNITEEVTVESIQVEISTLKPNYNVDDFDLSTISIRVTFSDGKFQIIPITESMLTEEHLSLLSNVGEHQITITYQGKSTTINLNLQYDSLKTQLMTLYTLSTTSGSFSGTYEEWLETVRGPQGNPGREVSFQVSNGYIQWQYVGESSWINLVELTSLVGPAGQDGVDGTDGKQVTFQVSEGFIQWQYVGDTTWTNLIDLQTITGADGSNGTDGADGREVLFQVAEGYIQWQYTGDSSWTNLVELTSLVGPAGQDGVDGINGKQVTFQVSEGFIQWQYVGDTTWTNLIDLQTITGADGSNGTDGADGREVLFQVAEGYIQWQYTGDSSWTNLVELTSLVGPAGQDGVDGINGKQVTFQVSEGFIQWQYVGDTTWTNLIDLQTITGADGSNGTDGADGREVLFQVAEGYIQWQYTGDSSWTNLVELTTLVGPAGADGVNGIDGKQVTFQVSEGYIQWQYVGDETWTNLVSLSTLTGSNGTDGVDGKEVLFQVADGFIQWQYAGDTAWTNLVELTTLTGLDGQDGLSAYEIYLVHYPDYVGTEAEWLDDLINGLLGTKDVFTITFDSNGGTEITSQDIETGSKIQRPDDPIKEGYTFEGWYIDDEKWSFIGFVVTEDLTLTARWTIAEYTVSFDTAGGSIIEPIVQNYDSIVNQPIDPEKYDYIFLGWKEDLDNTEFYNFSTMPAKNITLYAVWEEIIRDNNFIVQNQKIENQKLYVDIVLSGNVQINAFSGNLVYNELILQFYTIETYLPLTYNIGNPGSVMFNYVDALPNETITTETKIFTIVFDVIMLENTSIDIIIDDNAYYTGTNFDFIDVETNSRPLDVLLP